MRGMQIDDTWGALTCTDIRMGWRIAWGEPGKTKQYKEYQFKCECGEVVEIFAKDFKGKTQMLDCGQCGRGASLRNVTLTVYVPVGILDILDEFGKTQTNKSRGQLLYKLVQKGWEASLVE